MQESYQIPPFVLVFCKALIHIRFIKDCLSEKFDILDVENQSTFFEMLSSVPVDFVIIDERVIEKLIDDFLKEVQKINQDKKITILLLTRNLKKSFDAHVKTLGVDFVIREPIDKALLIKAVSKSHKQERLKTLVSGIALKQIPDVQTASELGIHQRLQLNHQAQTLIKKTLSEKGALTLLMIEIDKLKQQTQAHGDKVEDPIIQAIEQKIKKYCRNQDLLIALGAGKFVLLLPKTSKAVGKHLAEEIQHEIHQHPLILSNITIHLTVSIGIAEQAHIADETQSMKQFHHALTKAISYTIIAKEKGNQIISEPKS